MAISVHRKDTSSNQEGFGYGKRLGKEASEVGLWKLEMDKIKFPRLRIGLFHSIWGQSLSSKALALERCFRNRLGRE